MTLTVATKDLPETLRAALKQNGFNRADIRVATRDKFSPLLSAGHGQRGFICVVNLATGETKGETGSWGGSNPFEAKVVDRDDTTRPLPVGFAVILGYEGGGRPTSASITVHPDSMNPRLLGGPKADLSPELKAALHGVKHLKSGPYRVEHFERCGLGVYGPTNPAIVELAALGLVAINKAGAVSPTTAGKNASIDGMTKPSGY